MYTLTDRDFRLRQVMLPDDVKFAVPWYHSEVLYYSEGGAKAEPYSAEKILAMYEYLLNRAEVFIIEVQSDGGWLPIGDVAFFHEIGIPIVIGNPKYRSMGLGKRVIQLIINHAKEQGREYIRTNGIYIFNMRSRRLFESLGFSLVEIFIDDVGNECCRYNLVL